MQAQKKTRRMAIANGTCVSFCNQPKAHFGLPWVRPWDNCGKCYMMERGFNAGQKRSSIPIYLQPFTNYSETLVGNCNLLLPPCI